MVSQRKRVVVLASAARTATPTAVEIDCTGHSGIIVFLDATVDPSTASIVLNIDGYDSDADAAWTLLDSAAVNGVSHNVYIIRPGATVTANVSANQYLPEKIRITPVHADAESFTYSVIAWLLP